MIVRNGYFLEIQSPEVKKNDHVCHNSCLTYLIKYYDEKRKQKNKSPIPYNIVWSDNCPTQYKCRQNFSNVAHASNTIGDESIIVHKFAQKYRFKGSWDATGKIVKQQIANNEFKFDRCANAWDCYLKLKRDLTKSGEEKKALDFTRYEVEGDANILKNTTLTTIRTHIGFGTEDRQQYESLIHQNYEHIVFTNRVDIPNPNPVTNTLKIAQVGGASHPNANGNWTLCTSILPCSCPQCRLNLNDGLCYYSEVRDIKKVEVSFGAQNINNENDIFGLQPLTIAQLKDELRLRQLRVGGRKQDLINRLEEAIQNEIVMDDAIINENEEIIINNAAAANVEKVS